MFQKPNSLEYIQQGYISRERRMRRWLSWVMTIISVAFVAALLLTGCSTDDDRDECCEEAVLIYRYIRQERDEYKEFVKVMRHFLFDGNGRFLHELPFNAASPQQVRISGLPAGSYTVVTIANLQDGVEKLSELAQNTSSVQDFLLSVVKKADAAAFANTDELFWATRPFTVERDKRHRYICDLSNIHCHLFVKVFWHNRPKHNGNYTMQIEGVSLKNSLDPQKTHTLIIRADPQQSGGEPTEIRVIHKFPALTDAFGAHKITVPLHGMELQGEFITLRYTNKHIPVFRLYFGNEAVTKPIDLTKAFASWGWRPDEHPEQIYRIEMEIFDDGTVVVNQWADASVKDWQDGGSFGSGV